MKKLLLVITVAFLTGCAMFSEPLPTVYLNKYYKMRPPTDPAKVSILTREEMYRKEISISREYENIGTVFVVTSDNDWFRGENLEAINKQFREKSSQIGGDAVIDVHEEFDSHEYLYKGTTNTTYTYTLTGTVIRFKRVEEFKEGK